MYSKGEESDEKLHAAFHSNTTKGLRYQGSQQERVVLVDGTRGRVVLLSGSEAARCKKVGQGGRAAPSSRGHGAPSAVVGAGGLSGCMSSLGIP